MRCWPQELQAARDLEGEEAAAPWPQAIAGRAGRNVSLRGYVGGKPRDARQEASTSRYLEEERTE